MRLIFTLWSLIYLESSLYALEISEKKLEKLFEKICQQSIHSAISFKNNNTCKFTYINKFPKKSKEKLKQLNHQVIQLKKELSLLKNKENTTVINNKKIIIIEQKETDLSKIENELQNLKKIGIQNNRIIKDVQKKLRQEYQNQLKGITKQYQLIRKDIQGSIQEVNELRKEMNYKS